MKNLRRFFFLFIFTALALVSSSLKIGHYTESFSFGSKPSTFQAKNPKKIQPSIYAIQTLGKNTICKPIFEGKEIKQTLLGLIELEQESIQIASFRFTDTDIAHALEEASKKRNIKVTIVSDAECPASPNSKIPQLAKIQNIAIQLFPKPSAVRRDFRPLMHDKFMIFNRNFAHKAIVVTGSFNYTKKASETNKENIVVIDHPAAVESYRQEFQHLYAQSAPFHELKRSAYSEENLGFIIGICQWMGF